MNQITTFHVFSLFFTALWSAIAGPVMAQVRITEYMYNGSEFIEFTNIGNVPVDMTGWSFTDNNPVPAPVSLSAFGIIQPGESVILAESPAEDFRAHWDLCSQVKVIGDNTTNLGRNDEINLFDAEDNLVDKLAYGDQDFPGTPRTQDHSAWVSETGLGANDISEWTLSSSGDTEGSFASVAGQYGSPGKSSHATVAFDPCDNDLPVTLVSFTATRNEAAIDLLWEIADYEDGTVFEIQRSFSGYSFETIHRIPAVSDRQRFSFRDENAATTRQIIYYRLGITGADGKTELSIIRVIETDGPGEMISIYPNPATGGALTVKTIEKNAATLKVYNSLGIEQRRIEFNESTSFDTSNWPSGTYLIHFTTSTGQQFRRTLVVAN